MNQRVLHFSTANSFTAEDLPVQTGAYAFAVDLQKPLPARYSGHSNIEFEKGRYVYCGSAYGPGGLRARLGRHMRQNKVAKWHIDQLTIAAGVAEILAVPAGDECDILAELLRVPEIEVPAPGFGSSDCRSCPSHLVKTPEGFDLRALITNGVFQQT